jgi:plasmid stabilization system protein ParE
MPVASLPMTKPFADCAVRRRDSVFWSDAALAQLAAIRDYISQTSPVYADRVIGRVFARGKQLGEFPLSGRQVPERLDPALREVIEWPYAPSVTTPP